MLSLLSHHEDDALLLCLEFDAARLLTLLAGSNGFLRETFSEGRVAKVLCHRSKTKEVLESVVSQQACDDTHRRWKGRGTDPILLQSALVDV